MALANSSNKEEHLEVGSILDLQHKLEFHHDVSDPAGGSYVYSYSGMRVIENKDVPAGDCWLVDTSGKVLKKFTV